MVATNAKAKVPTFPKLNKHIKKKDRHHLVGLGMDGPVGFPLVSEMRTMQQTGLAHLNIERVWPPV